MAIRPTLKESDGANDRFRVVWVGRQVGVPVYNDRRTPWGQPGASTRTTVRLELVGSVVEVTEFVFDDNNTNRVGRDVPQERVHPHDRCAVVPPRLRQWPARQAVLHAHPTDLVVGEWVL